VEIERKYLVDTAGIDIEAFPAKDLEQGYLCTDPVVRVRREGESCYLTYKSGYGVVRREENLPLTRESYEHLLEKADGFVITKKRYRIPVTVFLDAAEADAFRTVSEEEIGNAPATAERSVGAEHLPDGKTVELDVFSGEFKGMVVAEIEFPTKEAADAFRMPKRFYKEVTFDPRYINSEMSKNGRSGVEDGPEKG